MAEASDMISMGDQLSTQIRGNQQWSLLPNFGFLSSVGPTIVVQGRSLYPAFPQILGKMSSAKKAKRLIKEVKQALAHRVYANKFSIQNEMIPAILQEIMTYFKKSSTESMQTLIRYMDDMNLSNEMFKEHLMSLSLSPKLEEDFKKISPGTKANFTRQYNKMHQAITRVKAGNNDKPK